MMTKTTDKAKNKSHGIDGLGITNDTLTSRGGLALFVKYLRHIGLLSEIESRFGRLRKSAKGVPVAEMFKQVICFFIDGTSRHLTWFDALLQDEGYARGIETAARDMASSHAVKRFFRAFSPVLIWLFRPMLHRLFIWRLGITRPEVVVLGIDTMVMDNNEAKKRHGVQPTYKKKAGFQPLQMTWGRFIVDAVFRGGKKHSNHGDTVLKMILHQVANIRTGYRGDVPIVVVMDGGFFDQKLFRLLESLEVGYICGGRLSEGVKQYVRSVDASCFHPYENGSQVWDYLEFGDRPGAWDRGRRAVFCRPRYEDRQALLEFARPDTVMYTNLGMGGRVDERLKAAGKAAWIEAEGVIGLYHGRGRDELVFRSLKDFGFQELPFKCFTPNAALYQVMLLAFFLFEAYKEDVLEGVIPVSAYPTTVRRKAVDFAAKIVRTGGRTILKVTEAVWDRLNLPLLWERSGCPPKINWA
jgi:hypothetical protein